MRDADWFWAALAVTGVAFEAWALTSKRDELTLSRSARRAFRAHTPAGRFALVTIVGAGSTALAHHLLTTPTEGETP